MYIVRISKTNESEYIYIFKKSDFELKFLQRARYWIRKVSVSSASEWKFLQRKRFWITFFITRRIPKQVFQNVSDFQKKKFGFSKRKPYLSPPHKLFATFPPKKPTTATTYDILIEKLKASNRRSNENLCTLFHSDSSICFYSAFPLFSPYRLYKCKNWLPLKVLKKIEPFLPHTCLTSFENDCNVNEAVFLTVYKITHMNSINLFKQIPWNKFLETTYGTFSNPDLPNGWIQSWEVQ